MSDKLQQAITATRSGQKREAQQLLAEVLEENPNNEHAWFLLGNLVESPEMRQAYLGKALAINPNNQKAKQQFVQVKRQVAVAPVAKVEPVETFLEPEEEEMEVAVMPDWLSEPEAEEPEMAVIAEEVVQPKVQAIAPVAKEKKVKETAVATTIATKSDREKQLQRYNYMLIILVILIVLVLIFLVKSL